MSTRAAAAASSLKVKRELVRLLFAPQYARKGPAAHRKLDPHEYTYLELRKAYLQRLQAIHPDKHKATVNEKAHDDDLHSNFVELQDAWTKYEQVAKAMLKVGKGKEANFTLFGVGCSFSDNATERAVRHEITEQACRGWFSSGELAETVSKVNDDEQERQYSSSPTSLVDHDDLFVEDTGSEDGNSTDCEQTNGATRPKPSLVGSFRPRSRRRDPTAM